MGGTVRRLTWTLAALAASTLVLGVGPAVADVTPPCDGWAEIDGTRYTPANDSPSNPVVVPPGDLQVRYFGSTGFDNNNHQGHIAVDLGPIAVTLGDWKDRDPAAPNSPSADGDRTIGDLRDRVPFELRGLYRVSGAHSADGGSCSGFALVKFDGPVFDSFITTAAAGDSVLGLLLIALAGLVPMRRAGTDVVRGRPVLGAIGGLVTGVGLAVMLQQLAFTPLTTPVLIGLPMLGALLGVGFALFAPFGRNRARVVDLTGVESSTHSSIEISDTTGGLADLQSRLDAIDAELQRLLVVEEATSYLPALRSTLQDATSVLQKTSGEHPDVGELKDRLDSLCEVLEVQNERIKEGLDALGKVGDGVKTSSEWMEKTAAVGAELDKALDTFQKIRGSAMSNDDLIDAFDQYIGQTLGLLAGLVKGMPTFGPMLEQYAKAVSSITGDLKKIAAATERTNAAIRAAGDALGRAPAAATAPPAFAGHGARIAELREERAQLLSQVEDRQWRLAEGTAFKLHQQAVEAATRRTGKNWDTARRIVGDAIIQSNVGTSAGVSAQEVAEARRTVRSGFPDYIEAQDAFREELERLARERWDRMSGMERRALLHHEPWLRARVSDLPLGEMSLSVSPTV